MTSENLNATSYESLARGRFDADKMDKFSCGYDVSAEGLFDFIRSNPSGYVNKEVTTHNPTARTPFWGSVRDCIDFPCERPDGTSGTCWAAQKRKYICWILVSTKPDGAGYGSCP